MRFSASMLNTYMSCPRKAKLHYFEKLPRKQNAKASFGVCIHHALEQYNNTGNLDLAITLFKDTWLNPEKLGVEPEVWPKFTSFGSLMERGEQILREYHDKQRWESRRVIATEHEFHVPIGEHTLYGFIDCLEAKKSSKGVETLRVVDYKTNSRAPSLGELYLNIQFTVYAYAVRQPEFWDTIPAGPFLFDAYKDAPSRSIWYHLMTNKEIDAGERDERDFERMYRVMEQIAEAIEKDVFVPDISGDTCTYCDFKDACGLRIPTREEVLDEDSFF